MGEALAITSLGFFAANALLVSAASKHLPQRLGFLLALASNLVFSGFAVAFLVAFSSEPIDIDWYAVGLFAGGGLLTSYVGRRLFFYSVQEIGPSRASAIQITNPLFAGIISWLFLGETLSAGIIALVILAVLGLLLTSQTAKQKSSFAPSRSGTRTGRSSVALAADTPRAQRLAALYGVLGATAYGTGNVVRGAGIREWNEPIIGSFIGALAATLCYALVHVNLRSLVADLRLESSKGIWLWLISGCLTISAQTALIAAMRHVEVVVSVVLSAALPIVIIPLSMIFFKNQESISARTVVGTLLILAATIGLVVV